MLRSLAAVIVAIIAGLTLAKIVEGGGAALVEAQPRSGLYQGLLALSWFAGAFAAGVIALLIARRWAPVGIIAASSIFLSAFTALVSAPLSWLLWPAAIIATGAGAQFAIMATKATFAPPAPRSKGGLFE